MMKHDKLLDAIGQVEDSLIDEAEEIRRFPKAPITHIHWGRWAATAAALALVIGLGYGAMTRFPIGMGGSGSAASSSTDNAAEAPAESAAGEESLQDSDNLYASSEGDPAEAGQTLEPPEDWASNGNSESAETPAAEAPAGEVEIITLTDPPTLYVSGTAILSGNYEWTSPDGDEMRTVIACGSSPLDKEETITRISLPASRLVFLDIAEDGLTDISAYCYPGDSWGNDQAEPVELAVDGTTITLPDSTTDWIVVVNMTWNAETYHGNAEYHFLIQRSGS